MITAESDPVVIANLGADAPWQIRDFPQRLREQFVADAKAARLKPGEHLTGVLIRAREHGLWGGELVGTLPPGWEASAPAANGLQTDKPLALPAPPVARDLAPDLAGCVEIAARLAELGNQSDEARPPARIMRALWRTLNESQRALRPRKPAAVR